MTKQILTLILFFSFFSCKKAETEKIKQETEKENIKIPPRIIIDYDNLIGFACYNSGKKSDPVKKISEILKKKEYKIIIKKLTEKNVAEKFLATVSCEKLQQKKMIYLTKEELKQMEINKKSNEIVSTCSGCTNSEIMTLNELFTTENNYIKEETEDWLNEMIK
jgi:hypothetical protein